MKPHLHAESSAKKFGGKPEDYIKIHNWFDQTKASVADQRHRAILHSAFGIFLCEQVFGDTITNSDNKVVSVRDIGEQHVIEDFGGKFIPTMQDWIEAIEFKPWMNNGNGLPPSRDRQAPDSIQLIPSGMDIVVDGSRPFENPLKFPPSDPLPNILTPMISD
jgi:hypothetical protein